MRRSLFYVLLLSLLLVVSGCVSDDKDVSTTSSLAISMEIPTSLIAPTAAYPTVASGSVTLIKGSTELTVPLVITGNIATANVTSPGIGNWTIHAELKDIDNYIIYEGTETAVVQGKGRTTVNMHLQMTPGDATAVVDLTNVTDVASGIVRFSNAGTVVFEQPLTLNTAQGTAAFNTLDARVWDIEIELYDTANVKIVGAKDSLQIFPGRMNYVTTKIGKTGDVVINVTWELPPTPPTGVTATIVNNQVMVSWNANTETNIAGYRVYRGYEEIDAYERVSGTLVIGNSFVDADTYPGHVYWYKVIAVNDRGIDSGFSTSVSVDFNYTPTPVPGDITLAQTPAPKIGIDLQRTNRSPYLGPQSANMKWRAPITPASISSPVIGVDGNIYIASTSGKLYAFDRNGFQKWVFTAPQAIYATPTIASDGTLLFGVPGDKFYALNPDGSIKWTADIACSSQMSSGPAISSDGTIYVGGSYHLYALNSDGTMKWRFATNYESNNGDVTIGKDGTIYISVGLKVFAINPDGTQKWAYTSTQNCVLGGPVLAEDGSIYIATNKSYYALAPNGTLKWSIILTCTTSPSLATDGTQYITASGALKAISPDGQVLWTRALEPYTDYNGALIGADGTIYVSSTGYIHSCIHAVYPNGDIKWSYTFSGEKPAQSTPTLDYDGTLYVATNEYLYAFK